MKHLLYALALLTLLTFQTFGQVRPGGGGGVPVPIATTSQVGTVKPDGNTLTIDATGKLSAVVSGLGTNTFLRAGAGLSNSVATGGTGSTNTVTTAFPTVLYDSRPLTNFYFGRVSLTGITPTVTLGVASNVMSYTGQGTITLIHEDLDFTNCLNVTNAFTRTLITIVTDQVTNVCTLGSFFAMNGLVYPFHGHSTCFFNNIQATTGSPIILAGAERFFEPSDYGINFWTNAAVYITCLDTNIDVYSAIRWRIGTPVAPPQRSYWHIFETNSFVGTGSNWVFFTNADSGGELEATYGYFLSTNNANGPGYLEGQPLLSLDNTTGNPVNLVTGTECWFGGSWYFAFGNETFADARFGNQAGPIFLQSLPFLAAGQANPYIWGNSSYVYYAGAIWTNTVGFAWPSGFFNHEVMTVTLAQSWWSKLRQ